jgi:hypothetical protein
MIMSDVNLDREIAFVKLQNEIALVKLQNDYKLACLGLQGTLWGAWAALIAIVAIAAIQAVTDRHVVEGWAFFWMVAAIVVAVTFYGAFIFNRALSVSAKIERQGGSFFASSERSEPPRAPDS